MEGLFVFFFKYRPFFFREGEFTFQWRWENWQLLVLFAFTLIGSFLVYREWIKGGHKGRWLLPSLRAVSLSLPASPDHASQPGHLDAATS